MEKSCRKYASKATPDPFLIFLNNPKEPLHTKNYYKNKVFWKSIVQKSSES